jgi:hypothetical protein
VLGDDVLRASLTHAIHQLEASRLEIRRANSLSVRRPPFFRHDQNFITNSRNLAKLPGAQPAELD